MDKLEITPPSNSNHSRDGTVSGVVTSPNESPMGLAVRLYIDGSATPVGVTVSDGNGTWSVPTGHLAAGPHLFSVEIDERAGAFLVGSPVGDGSMDFSNSLNSGLLAAIAA